VNRPRLLFVSPRFLFPLDQGGKIRTVNILRRLKGGAFEVILASPVPANVGPFIADIAAACDRFVSWPAPRVTSIRRARAALFDRLPVAAATDRSPAGRREVAAELARAPDVVVADFPHAAVLLPPGRLPVASVLFTHNVEAEIFERQAKVSQGAWRALWQSQARKMRRFEGEALRRFDTVIAVSARDAAELKSRYLPQRLATIDTGVDLDFFPFQPPPQAPEGGGTVIFTGTMSWPANAEGLGWMLEEVWPRVRAARPAARAVIVGRGAPDWLMAKAREAGAAWEFTGFVDDIRPHVHAAHAYVIPLRVGSGTRIKAFEAIAMGCPMVSTHIGIEGLDIAHGQHFLAADSAEDFAAAILCLLDNPAQARRIASQGRALVEEKFSWSAVARQFETICLAACAARGESVIAAG
jgi:glycosyltransferase involved in cell wall biosynthesis